MTCFIHVRRNVKDKLHECNVPTQVGTDIMDDIFGKRLGSDYIKGLVDASDTIDFQEKMQRVVETWRNIAIPSSANMDRFVTWFVEHKAPVIRDSMLQSVREECDLGLPPTPFTTNACETANSMLKNQTKHKRSEMLEFLQKLKDLICEQEREMERSIVGRGKYELRPQYQAFQVPERKWFVMTVSQREHHLKKFANAALSDAIPSNDLSQSCDVDDTQSSCLGRDITASSLSMDAKAVADSVRIPLNCLEGIWSKAAELLRTKDSIVSAPGVGLGAKFVLSYSGKRPHLVLPKKGGSFVCDQDCSNWRALHICAHSVAVANLCSKLPEFIAWLKKSKKTPNLTNMAETTMPKGRGQKGTRCPRKRKSMGVMEKSFEYPSMVHSSSSDTQTTPSSCSLLPASVAAVSHVSNFQLPAVTHISSFPGFQTQLPYGHYSVPYAYDFSTLPFSPVPPVPHSVPFTLCKISGNISICAGCRNKYPKHPTPPDDLCIRHQEWREYIPTGSQVPQSRFGNTYYHFSTLCVRMRCPEFVPVLLDIPREILLELDHVHKERLQFEFQITL